ncbi:hypothetical protein SARC_02902 [Sphaeroforma arctica JP610]|uniref:Uncharacterized protein n=1 Tax=Sphaeroforma arctica JP610 TaxID=667725 RepID=A0A0L0G7J5_9EUKA|nr:hypothetical protein SARC_02902 [Sphaeroforma arctica JP610]KNC84894.1 hypothetical protein SARC_02902 [Sphaeroforma arctica JP610]|eukprot:XP_014158796.1 hypothetical protein SARC_02902 [Sphaeroforma arctica JP610]
MAAVLIELVTMVVQAGDLYLLQNPIHHFDIMDKTDYLRAIACGVVIFSCLVPPLTGLYGSWAGMLHMLSVSLYLSANIIYHLEYIKRYGGDLADPTFYSVVVVTSALLCALIFLEGGVHKKVVVDEKLKAKKVE